MMVTVAMVVFGECPILLRRAEPRSAREDNFPRVFESLRQCFHLGRGEDYASDAWTNAVVWMDLKRRATAENAKLETVAQQQFRFFKPKSIIKPSLVAVESKLRLLAGMVGLDEASQDSLCNGSFLLEVQRFCTCHEQRDNNTIETIWNAYLYAYRFNLVFVQRNEDVLKITDVSSGCKMDYVWSYLAIDLFDQARLAEDTGEEGFYATASILMGRGLRDMTALPVYIVSSITDSDGAARGAWDLRKYLKLD
ncbi:hypothetical protein GGR55DRAFT_386956 [Xylaria sp. FL0064]|nr:hypothetical protein GGR55DRAFT_386956 [Xylaria sp. FL0064]